MIEKFKIGYFADGIWAHNTFELLIKEPNIEVKFICVRFDSTDLKFNDYADKYGIDFLKHKNINSLEFLNKIKVYGCDLFVSMSFNQIFKEQIINMPKYKTINCHAGKLPFYRGRNILNWVLINDEQEFGITAHYVDEKIDTGDIIVQKIFSITDEDDYNTLLKRSYKECPNVLYKAINLIKSNMVKTIKQCDIHPTGFYCVQRKEGDELINWNQTTREIFNFIRAICKPGPMALTCLNKKKLKINKSKIIKNYPSFKGIPGSVIGEKDGIILVKTSDSAIELIEYEYDGIIKVGDRFNF